MKTRESVGHRTVYLVCGSSGDYEDHRVWNVRAFAVKEDAERFCARLDGNAKAAGLALRAHLDDDDEVLRPFSWEEWQRLDPRLDSTPTNYHVEPIALAGRQSRRRP